MGKAEDEVMAKLMEDKEGNKDTIELMTSAAKVTRWWDFLCTYTALKNPAYLTRAFNVAIAAKPESSTDLPMAIHRYVNKITDLAKEQQHIDHLVVSMQELPAYLGKDGMMTESAFMGELSETLNKGLGSSSVVVSQMVNEGDTRTGLVVIRFQTRRTSLWSESPVDSSLLKTPSFVKKGSKSWAEFYNSQEKYVAYDLNPPSSTPLRIVALHGKDPKYKDKNKKNVREDNLVGPMISEWLQMKEDSNVVVMADTNSEKFGAVADGFGAAKFHFHPEVETITTIKTRTIFQAQPEKADKPMVFTKDFILYTDAFEAVPVAKGTYPTLCAKKG